MTAPKTVAEAYADAAAEVRAMADYSCGCDPIYCRCRLDRELYELAAGRIDDRAAEVAEPAMPTLAAVIEHYGIDALCKALAPEIVREAGQSAPWTPPEDRGDGFECLAWLEANRLQTMGVGGWEKVQWKISVLRPPGYWWCPHGGEQVSPTAFAPLPGDAG